MYPWKSSLIVDRAGGQPDRVARFGTLKTAVLSEQTVLRSSQVRAPGSSRTTGFVGAPNQVADRLRWQRRYNVNLRITDTAVVLGAVGLAQYLRFGDAPLAPVHEDLSATVHSTLIAALWLGTLAGFRARSLRIIGRGIEEYRRVVEASLWTFVAIAVAQLVFRLDLARGYLAVALPLGMLGLMVNRWLWRKYLSRRRNEGGYSTTVLAVGKVESVTSLADELTRNRSDGYVIVGACLTAGGTGDDGRLSARVGEIPILGDETCILDALRTCGADTVAIAGSEHLGMHEIRRLIWQLEPTDVDLIVSPGVTDVAVSRLAVLPVSGIPMLQIGRPQYRDAQRFQKRAFDLCFATAALIAVLPILIASALAIKITSRGPILYRSERIGFGGSRFHMLKLRTMVHGADQKLEGLLASNECEGLLFKIRDDPRVTPVGRVLRRFSIDELPQFVNVLRREMSVVGPRPLFRVGDCEHDGDSERRLLVKPGITGMSQVSGRSDLSWDDTVRIDLSYVDNWSMATDIAIIAKTVRSVFQHEGAY